MKEISLIRTANRIYTNQKIVRADLENFAVQLKIFQSKINDKQREEHLKYPLRDFLKNTFYANHKINTKDNFDFAIHFDKNEHSKVGVLIETKAPNASSEMVSKDNLQAKSMYQILLYFLQERVINQNNDIKRLIITNFEEWFIFDARDFEKLFYQNSELQKEFKNWNQNQKTSSSTDLFYKEIAPKFIEKVADDLTFTYFNLKNINTDTEKNTKELIALYKVFSAKFLLKKPFANDANTLNKEFYFELLHIIGLEEQVHDGKNLIKRKKNKDAGSLIENVISTIDTENRLSFVKDIGQYGKTRTERIENIALELTIMWINRIIFLKLLEAQLISFNNDVKFGFLNTQKIKDFDELNELFFEILAKKVPQRGDYIKDKFKNIPYLNSSLFELSTLENQAIRINSLKKRLKLPLFSQTVLKGTQKELPVLEYLFRFLNAFDFTNIKADQVQEEQKNLINAAVLGLIFEKINGYKEGSFFTPSYVTTYMSSQTIRAGIVQKFQEAGYKKLANFEDLKDLIEDRKEANKIINQVKICDPSVGSGHFLVSALNEIIAIKSELGILEYRNGRRIKNFKVGIVNDELITRDLDDETIFEYHLNQKGNPIPYKQELQEALFHEKLTIIENCLFGVDINPNSVNICRLRLWVELLKNTHYTQQSNYKELEVLPNIDINIKQGNSLVSRFGLNGKKPSNGGGAKKKNALARATKKYKEQVILYKSTDNKEIKRNVEQEITKLKAEFAQNANPKDEDYIILQKKKAKLAEMPIFFSQQDKDNWLEATKKLTKEVAALQKSHDEKLKNLYGKAFEWRFEFPEVLDKNGNFEGFDVILGNPPYIEHKQLSEFNTYFKENYQVYAGTADISVYFFELAFSLIKKEGLFSYITTNKFFKTEYGKKLRHLLTSKQLIQLVNLEQVPVFDKALVSTAIIVSQKSLPSQEMNYAHFYKENIEDINLYAEVHKRNTRFKLEDVNSKVWKFIPQEEENIITKIENAGKTIKDNPTIQIRRGVTTGYDKAFIIDTKTYKKLVAKSEKNKEIIKPLLKGKDIKKYYNKYADLYLLYINWHFPLHKDQKISGASKKAEKQFKSEYKSLYNYLSRHKKELSKRNQTETGIRYEWYALQRQAATYVNSFAAPKLIWALTADKWGFSLDSEGYFLTSGGFFLTSEQIPIEFILAILNSKLMQFYFLAIGVMTAGGAYTLKKTTIERFHLAEPKLEIIAEILKLTNEILDIKKQNIENNTSDLESQIDTLIYVMYGLTKKEIRLVENKLKYS